MSDPEIPRMIYRYALNVVRGRVATKLEQFLFDNGTPRDIMNYACTIMKSRVPEDIEKKMFVDPRCAVRYARMISHERLPPEIEFTVSRLPGASADYACNVLKRRWHIAEYEDIIFGDPHACIIYCCKFCVVIPISYREGTLTTSRSCLRYALSIRKRLEKKYEDMILAVKSSSDAYIDMLTRHKDRRNFASLGLKLD